MPWTQNSSIENEFLSEWLFTLLGEQGLWHNLTWNNYMSGKPLYYVSSKWQSQHGARVGPSTWHICQP
jgi:hypothetical protein